MRASAVRLSTWALGLLLSTAGLGAGPQQPQQPQQPLQPPAAVAPSKTPAKGTGTTDTAPRRAPAPAPAPRTKSATNLDVTVLDPAGRPVEGALVTALPVLGGYDGMRMSAEKFRSAITAKDGRARLERMPIGPWSVTVQARGFQSAHEARASSATLTMKLEKGGTITGVVRDGTTKAPVPGARVMLQDWMQMPGDWQERVARNEAVSDAKGLFRLEGVGHGAVAIVARANGYGPATRSDARAGVRLELFLFPGPTLSGTVRDEAGKPIAGASVRLFAQGWEQPPPVDATDAGGRFTAAGTPPGEYWVVARAGGRAPGLAQIVVTERDDANVDVVLGDGGYVSGRTVDGSGQPIAGASVRPEAFGGRGLPQLVSDSLATSSRADGAFALGPLASGSFSLVFAHRGHASSRAPATVAALQSVDLRDVVLESGLAIRGRVRDRGGAPLSGVLVRAQPRQGGEEPRAEAETEADGAFVLAGLTAGSYVLTAEAAGYAHGRAMATAGSEPIAIVLDAGATIVGRVADAAGQPVTRANISGEATDDDSPLGHASVYASVADEGDGRFTIRDAVPGTYVLRVVAAGAGRGSLSGVKVTAGRTTDVGTISLGVAGTVRGVVVDGDGQGVAGATIRVQPDTHRSYGDDPSAQSDSNGSFEAYGVQPGRVDLVTTHPAFVSTRLTAVEVDPEKEPQSLRIVLTRGGRIEGRARRRDGRPFDDGRVTVWSSARNSGSPAEPTPTQPDGSFMIEHVPVGRVTVSLMTRVASNPNMGGGPGMTVLVGIASREVEVREGETAALDFVTREIVVSGRVTRSGDGVAGVVVNLARQDGGMMSSYMGMNPTAMAPPSGPPPLTATTREDGAYELLVFGPGKNFVQLRSPERQAFPGREVDIPDGERYELDLEVGGANVSGIVVDKDSGAPIPEVQLGLREPGTEGQSKGGAASGPDGRFTIAVEPGEYVLQANARSRRKATLPVSVGAGGLADVRVELETGLEIRGRVVDLAGRPVPDASLVGVDADGETTWFNERSLPDGSFRLTGLDAKAYVLLCGAERFGFAMRSGATAGGDPLTVTLHPGGRVLARVIGPDGAPAKDVWPQVTVWEGVRFRYLPGSDTHPTGTPGEFEMSVPVGSLELSARRPGSSGKSTVQTSTDKPATVQIMLRESAAH